MASIAAMRTACDAYLCQITPLVEAMHEELNETLASEKQLRFKFGGVKRERDDLLEQNKRLKREESSVTTSCPVCRESGALEQPGTSCQEAPGTSEPGLAQPAIAWRLPCHNRKYQLRQLVSHHRKFHARQNGDNLHGRGAFCMLKFHAQENRYDIFYFYRYRYRYR
eukprot:366263-Chlamydomonas_euryale.AAC.6